MLSSVSPIGKFATNIRQNRNPLEFQVLMNDPSDLILAQRTIHGLSKQEFSVKNVTDHVDEILSMRHIILPQILDVFSTILFWRCHGRLRLFVPRLCPQCRESGFWNKITRPVVFCFPLHSIVAFLSAITVVELPHLIPTFLFGLGAYFMFANLSHRNQHPSPWKHSKSFSAMTSSLLWGVSWGGKTIKAYENESAIMVYEQIRVQKQNDLQEAEQICSERALCVTTENTISNQDKIADSKNIEFEYRTNVEKSLNDINHMIPIQHVLANLCLCLRYVREVVCWDDANHAYWLTIRLLILSVASYFIPWGLVFLWTCRALVWSLLGPWMKLVEIFWFGWPKGIGNEFIQDARWKKIERLLIRLQKERELKIKLSDMKKRFFGPHLINVPQRKVDRYVDTPISLSFATQFKKSKKKKKSRATKTNESESFLHAPKQSDYHNVQSFVPGQSLIIEDVIPKKNLDNMVKEVSI